MLHAQLTVTECNFTRILGDVVAAIAPTERAIPLLREHIALDDLFDAYNVLTGCNMQLREFEKVPDQLNELEAIASETNMPKLYGVYYVSKSYYEDYMGNTEASLAFAEKGLAAFRDLEDTYYEAIVLDGIARRLKTLNRDDEALAVMHRAFKLAEENNQPLTKAFLQRGIATHYREQGMLVEAETAVSLSRQLFTEVNDLRYLVDIDYLEALIAYDREQWAVMTRFLIATLQRAMAYVIKRHMLNTLAYLPILQWYRGEKEQAQLLYLFTKQHEPFDNEQHAIVAQAKALIDDSLTPQTISAAQPILAELNQETILNNFLREGFRWFDSPAQ